MTATRFDIPSISTLVAFEATARLGGVNRAAGELRTSQSAISRYIRNLETSLEVKLFERRNRGVVLTKCGEDYHAAVQLALESLHAASVGCRTQQQVLTIGCTQEVSVLLVSPVFGKLKRSLPEGVRVRILSRDDDTSPLASPTGVDIEFTQSVTRTDEHSVRVLDEEIVPVAAPSFLRRFEQELSRHPQHWTDVPRLEVTRRDKAWATWSDWFAAHDCDPPQAPIETFENYLHLLDAAAEGDGMAIGWNGFVGRYFETGRLLPLRDEWLRSELGLYAVVTPFGRGNPNTSRCLRELTALVKESATAKELPRAHQAA